MRSRYYTLFNGEKPDRSAFGHFRKFAWEGAVEPALHSAGVPAIPCVYGDILLAVEQECSGRGDDARVSRPLPQQFAGGRVKGMDQTICGPTAENQSAAGCQHAAPV